MLQKTGLSHLQEWTEDQLYFVGGLGYLARDCYKEIKKKPQIK